MKLKGPLHSQSASGTFGGLLTFSNRKSGAQVRFQKKQKDVITAPRSAQRAKFLIAVDMWKKKDYGVCQFGYNLLGANSVSISSLPYNQRAPQFARFVSEVLNFYL